VSKTLQVQTFTFNAFQENTYLITNAQNQCWIVDPGMFDIAETNHFFDYINHHHLIPQAVINTHTHLDHIFGVHACMEQFNIPFLIHEKDVPVLDNAQASAALFGFRLPLVPRPSGFIDEGRPFVVGNESLSVLFTPGHSPGSISFYHEAGGWVIGGDVLFNGSIGRTDLPGGNYNTLIESIRKEMLVLPDETIVYSGHGPSTTIGRERRSNPFLQ